MWTAFLFHKVDVKKTLSRLKVWSENYFMILCILTNPLSISNGN
jgi:hypothetical protein